MLGIQITKLITKSFINTVLLLGKAQEARPATQVCSKVSEEIDEGARLGFIVVCVSQYPGERTAVTNVTLTQTSVAFVSTENVKRRVGNSVILLFV